jgi:cytochrome bd ubiquinol oxidase subunit I
VDAVLLSRIQFAFTVGFHFLFVPLSLGTAVALVLAERRFYKTGLDEDGAVARFCVRLFTATFAIGVATGITMEFAFGTNWAAYSRFVGDIFGAPLAAEGLLSFFLESTFLGVLLFGRNRVSRRFYYVSAWLVAIGAHLSALWIIIANSWQQTPAGYEVVDGRAVLTDFFAAALNPSTLPRYFHTVASTWAVGAFFAAGVAAYYLRKGRHTAFAKRAIRFGLVFGLVMSLAMPLLGHWSATQVADTQPAKMAAFEGLFKTQDNADLSLVGWVDQDNEKLYAITIPSGLSLMLGFSPNTVVTGLDKFAPADRPPVELTFQMYHLMVGLGVLMIAWMLIGVFLWWRGRLDTSRRYLGLTTWSFILPMLAIQTGWAAAEIGRQPWIVYNELRTVDGVSAVVPAGQVALSLGIFAVIYALLFVAWVRVLLSIVRKGPELPETEPGFAQPDVASAGATASVAASAAAPVDTTTATV